MGSIALLGTNVSMLASLSCNEYKLLVLHLALLPIYKTASMALLSQLTNFEELLKDPKYKPLGEYWQGLAENEFHLYEVVFTEPAE